MPTLAQLDDAMAHPGRFVPAINRLGGGTIAAAGGRPLRVVGDAAAVYQLRQPNGRVLAIRCPLADEQPSGTLDRYRALDTAPAVLALRGTPVDPVLAVSLIPDGIALPAAEFRSTFHPVIAMDWVMGPTLLTAADRACRARNRPALQSLASAWLAAIEALDAVGFAHGDLTGDNVLIDPRGAIKLVDYDTCVWAGMGSARLGGNPGTPGYDHPTGEPLPAPLRRDDFAAIVIYVSLRVLADQPDLRPGHGDPATEPGGTLLFSPWDLADPEGSDLFANLLHGARPDIAFLVETLGAACLAPADVVLSLTDVVASVQQANRSSRPAARAPTPPASTDLSDPRERQRRLTRLNSLLLAGDDEAARRYWEGSGLAADPDAAREIGPRIAEIGRNAAPAPWPERTPPDRHLPVAAPPAARERRDPATLDHLWTRVDPRPSLPVPAGNPSLDAAIADLRDAVANGDAARVSAVWPAVRDDPRASPFAIPAAALLESLITGALADALDRGDDDALVAGIRDAEDAGVPVPTPTRRAARAARARIGIRRDLAAALATDDRETLASLAIAHRLEDLGPLTRSASGAIVRALEWPHVARALASDDDALIAATADPALLADDGIAAADRDRIALAHARRDWQVQIRAALAERNAGAVAALTAAPPEAALDRLTGPERRRIARLVHAHEAGGRSGDGPDAGNDHEAQAPPPSTTPAGGP